MFDRSWSVYLPANAGPAVVPIENLSLPGGDPDLEVWAWQSSLQGANVFLFDDGVALVDAQNRATRQGPFDALMVVPRGGIGKVNAPGDMAQRLTVFFDTTFASPQAVTVRIREIAGTRKG